MLLLLLLSLLVLSTGSDARRIRKRGLNHKVGLLTSPLTFVSLHVWVCVASLLYLLVSRLFSEKQKSVEVGERSQCYSTVPALLQRAGFTLREQFCGGGESWSGWPQTWVSDEDRAQSKQDRGVNEQSALSHVPQLKQEIEVIHAEIWTNKRLIQLLNHCFSKQQVSWALRLETVCSQGNKIHWPTN